MTERKITRHADVFRQIYIALLKFDFFFFLAFTVQFLVIIQNTKQVELYLTIAAIPITIVLLFLAGYWVRREVMSGMVCIIVRHLPSIPKWLPRHSLSPTKLTQSFL